MEEPKDPAPSALAEITTSTLSASESTSSERSELNPSGPSESGPPESALSRPSSPLCAEDLDGPIGISSRPTSPGLDIPDYLSSRDGDLHPELALLSLEAAQSRQLQIDVWLKCFEWPKEYSTEEEDTQVADDATLYPPSDEFTRTVQEFDGRSDIDFEIEADTKSEPSELLCSEDMFESSNDSV